MSSDKALAFLPERATRAEDGTTFTRRSFAAQRKINRRKNKAARAMRQSQRRRNVS